MRSPARAVPRRRGEADAADKGSALAFATLPFAAHPIADTYLELRRKKPRVHCLTNSVAQAFTANLLLAAGAIPSMTIAPEEIAHFVRRAGALLVNLGTPDPERRSALPLALDAAAEPGIPPVLDPVFA